MNYHVKALTKNRVLFRIPVSIFRLQKCQNIRAYMAEWLVVCVVGGCSNFAEGVL
jgi:hypothetical protein